MEEEKLKELDRASRTHPKAGVRVKVIAVRAIAKGMTRQEVGAMVNASPYSVGQWYRAYCKKGIGALEIGKGRGRKTAINTKELEEYVRQSPRNFGVQRTRWTLELLAEKVPCLKGLKAHSVWYALRRAGLSYKRVEPWLHSPDPEYVKKKPTSKNSSIKRGRTRKR